MEQLKEIAEKLGLTFQAAWPHYVSYLQIRAVWPALCCILVCLVLAWFLYIPKATRQGWQDLIENETDAKEKETLKFNQNFSIALFVIPLLIAGLILACSDLVTAVWAPEGMAMDKLLHGLRCY